MMKSSVKIINQNKKVSFNYNVVQRIECGMVLLGTEVKSVRFQGCSIQEASCSLQKNTIYIYNMNIPVYKKCFQDNHEPKRIRSLLIEKKQAKKLKGLIEKNHLQIIPEKVFFNEKNLLKITLALGKISNKIDKREKIKAKESLRELKQIKTFIFTGC